MIGYNLKNSIKKKAIILVIVSFVAVTPIFAEEEKQSAYSFIQVKEPTQTSFTVYENNDINKPQYYEIKLNNTTYGTGESSKYYKWETNSSGHTTLVETVESDAQVIVNYDSSNQQIRLENTADISSSPLIGNYINQRTSTGMGGAIYNSGIISDIRGNFIDNGRTKKSEIGDVQGGAIYNSGTIENITGNFIANSMWAYTTAIGGSIYNESSANISNITGDFVKNSAYSGGAIYNGGTIDNITGDFVGNYASSSYDAYGGAIYNSGIISDIKGNFINNEAFSTMSLATGGAIYNSGIISDIGGNFIGNYAFNSVFIAKGGAIMNNEHGTITSISGNFVENSTIATNDSMGGAIYNVGSLGEIKGSLIGNYAKSETGTAKGGAIYSTKDIKLVADNANIEIRDNYTESAGVKDDNAVYLDNKDATLTLDIKNNGTLLLKDNIDGASGYKLNVIGDNTGILYLQNDIRNAKVSMGGITLNTINNDIHNYNFNSLTLANDINMAVDVDLANATMDRLSATSYGEHTGNLNITGMNLLSDANQEITSILFADNGLKDNVIYAGNELPHEGYQTSFYTPIYKYNAVYDNKDDGGYFVFTKGDKIYGPTSGGTAGGGIISSGNSSDAFNPAVLGGSTSATVGAIGTISQTINNSFHSVDTFMNLPSFDRISIKNQNKYAFNMTDDIMNLGRFSPLYQPQDEQIGVWIKPYATFESVPLKNGPKVNNIAYGTLVGFDTELKELGNGWDRVWTGYMGYNGASQHFSGVDSTQNGGLLGGTLTLYRGNFFNATTLNIGANVAENQAMYGTDNLTMLMSGVANKCGYNLEFKDGKLILQPNLILGYSFVNTFDYTNAAGLKIDNKPLHYIQVSPGVKLIGNLKNGWQPYASVNMVWNLMGETNSTANGIKLPEMTIKPYVQYGVGVQKRIKDKFTAYTQAMVHNGGRNGVALTFGFKWTLGSNDKKKSEKELKISDNKNIKRFEIKAKEDK